MKKEEVIKKVLKYLAQHGSGTNQTIASNIGVPFIQLQGVTKMLLSEKLVAYVKENKTYRLLESKKEEPVKATSEKAEPVAEKKETVLTNKSKRDFSKFKFGGQEYNKSRLVMAILSKFCEDHEPTLTELKDAFPDDVVKPYGYGLFRPAVEAKKVNDEGRQRFFAKDNELIKIKGGKIAASNQITNDLLQRFLSVAKKHKYVVK